jgi:hypothetical protein
MSKVHLLSQIIANLQLPTTQDEKIELLTTYNKEIILKRIISIAYNPWIDLGMTKFKPRHTGKQFGMGIARFLHILDDIIDEKYSHKEKEFSCNMALMHIEQNDAKLFTSLITQSLDLCLDIESINTVWPGLIMNYPISTPVTTDYKEFKLFPASVQPLSRGLRVNVMVYNDVVFYKDKLGNNILGWEIYDKQFINLAQGNNTVFDGHAVVAEGVNVVEVANDKVLEAEAENIRFMLWDVIRYDGFVKGEDTRMGYNWRYNGIEHMQILAIDKNPAPCYDLVRAELVGSQEQLALTVSKFSGCVIKSLDGIWKHGPDETQVICV